MRVLYNPTGPETGSTRVRRGGCWFSRAQDCRSAYRGSRSPDERYDDIGFRLVLNIELNKFGDCMKVYVNPSGPETGSYRVLRGGSWANAAWNCRSAYRDCFLPAIRNSHYGFRPVSNYEEICDVISNTKLEELDMEFVFVEPGVFKMGSKKSDPDHYADEERHNVALEGFWIKTTPVTELEWAKVMSASCDPDKTMLPKTNVSWNDCQEFIKKLNEKTGMEFSLPTEAQWEYAAKGGHCMPLNKKGIHVEEFKYAGGDDLDEVGWYTDNSEGEVHAVLLKKPNQLGLYDMSGNIWEWCQDWYNKDYEQSTSTDRVLRGGGWGNDARYCRVAYRDGSTPGFRHDDVGFRCVINPCCGIEGSFRVMRGGGWAFAARRCRSADRGVNHPASSDRDCGFRLLLDTELNKSEGDIKVCVNPRGPETSTERVVRGGCWWSFAPGCRSAFRNVHSPDARDDLISFRLVINI